MPKGAMSINHRSNYIAKNRSGLCILQVSPNDAFGGAAIVAGRLHLAYQEHGQRSLLAVGYKSSDDPYVLEIPRQKRSSKWTQPIWRLYGRLQSLDGRILGVKLLRRSLNIIAGGWPALQKAMGREDFNFPGSRQLLGMFPLRPDVIQAHNLHGNYFDLRYLEELSTKLPVILTLHDAWLLSGHCAHSLDCERWRTGCGNCPYLSIPLPVRRDATRYNWRRKQRIYANSRFYVATPCRWLMQKVEQSILAPAIIESRVIPNGVDLSIFKPSERGFIREALSISNDAKVVLCCANGIRTNLSKDYQTLNRAFTLVADRFNDPHLLLVALGEKAPSEKIGKSEVRFVPYQRDPLVVASYFQAADVYVHAARADTFPNSVLEALACGKPVVATAVGGIPEQIVDGQTGFLVPTGDARAMAFCMEQILIDDDLRKRMSQAAADLARRRFNLECQVDGYLNWYTHILEHWM